MFGKLVNAGQTCIAPDYVLLPRARQAEFVAAARAMAGKLYPNLRAQQQYASIVSDKQYDRLSTLRDDAVKAGARVEPMSDAQDLPAKRLLAPVLLTEVNDTMAVMQDEIFGPLLPVVPYDSLDDAIGYVAARPQPLALYLFEESRSTIDHVLARTQAGGVTINDTLYHIAQHGLPFGGVGPSGMGGYHGEAGFRTFSHMKPVFRQSRLSGTGMLNPPYGTRFRQMLRMLMRLG